MKEGTIRPLKDFLLLDHRRNPLDLRSLPSCHSLNESETHRQHPHCIVHNIVHNVSFTLLLLDHKERGEGDHGLGDCLRPFSLLGGVLSLKEPRLRPNADLEAVSVTHLGVHAHPLEGNCLFPLQVLFRVSPLSEERRRREEAEGKEEGKEEGREEGPLSS